MRPHELKLLVIFDAIMTENSVTRAAEQLSMTQLVRNTLHHRVYQAGIA